MIKKRPLNLIVNYPLFLVKKSFFPSFYFTVVPRGYSGKSGLGTAPDICGFVGALWLCRCPFIRSSQVVWRCCCFEHIHIISSKKNRKPKKKKKKIFCSESFTCSSSSSLLLIHGVQNPSSHSSEPPARRRQLPVKTLFHLLCSPRFLSLSMFTITIFAKELINFFFLSFLLYFLVIASVFSF